MNEKQKVVLSPMIKNLMPGLPEIGKIKIGMKGDKRKSSGGKEFQLPVKIDHFIITTLERGSDGNFIKDIEAHQRFGEEPKELPVRLLYNDPALNFQCRWACFVGTHLWCTGDGEKAIRKQKDENSQIVDCICERADPEFKTDQYRCKTAGVLSVMLESMERVGGVYKFRTTGYNTTVSLMSSLALIRSVTGGTLSGIPLVLTIRPKTVITPIENKTQTVYVVGLEYKGTMENLLLSGFNIAKKQLEYKQKIEDLENGVRQLIGNEILTENETEEDIAKEFYPEAMSEKNDIELTGPVATIQSEQNQESPEPDYSELQKLSVKDHPIIISSSLKTFIQLTAKAYKDSEQEIIDQAIDNPEAFIKAYENWFKKNEQDNPPEEKPTPVAEDYRLSPLYQDFDPYNEKIQGRYSQEKTQRLKDELDKLQIEYSEKMTPKNLHNLLLQHLDDSAMESDPNKKQEQDTNQNSSINFDLTQTDQFNELMALQERYPQYYKDVIAGMPIKTIEDIKSAISKIDALVRRLEGTQGIPDK